MKQISFAEKDAEDFFDKLYESFTTDDESFEKKGSAILRQYNRCSDEEKAVLNWMMINLTGWSIPSLWKMSLQGTEQPVINCIKEFEDFPLAESFNN